MVAGHDSSPGKPSRSRFMAALGLVAVALGALALVLGRGFGRLAPPAATGVEEKPVARPPIITSDKKQQFFAWLGWSPEPGSGLSKQLEMSFPGSLPGKAIVPRVVEALEHYGVVPENTIYGQSLCSDEINTEKEHLAAAMTDHWGHMFPLGGIGGAPYVGKTGFGAFSHHVPEDGNVVILFGPHVGISPDGEVGKFLRSGQHELTTACGASIAAFNQLTARPTQSDFDHDMEQSWLRSKLAPYVKEVQAARDPMVALAMKAYLAIEREIMEIASIDFGPGYLVLIGGVQINMPGHYQDHFLPLHFSIRSSEMKPVSLLGSFA